MRQKRAGGDEIINSALDIAQITKYLGYASDMQGETQIGTLIPGSGVQCGSLVGKMRLEMISF